MPDTLKIYLSIATSVVLTLLMRRLFDNWEAAMLVLIIIFIIDRIYRISLCLVVRNRKHSEEMAALQLRTIESLALAIEAKDHTTHDHLRRVQVYAVEIGKELNLKGPELQAIRVAAVLHDIGKLAVPEHILSKPGRLSPEEFEKLKIHPIVGAEILAQMQFPYPVVPIVLAHHERWDGLGYPYGLKGEQIPVGARILAAVDCLDAMASNRQYRRALPLDKAMEEVASQAGKAYDPKVVEILRRRYLELEQLAQPRPSTRRLSRDLRIPRGHAPATGFEAVSYARATAETADPFHFVDWISSARQEALLLQQLTSDLGDSLCLDETLSLLARRLKTLVPYDTIVVYVRSDDKLSPAHISGDCAHLFSPRPILVGQGLSGWVAEHNKPILNGNPSVEPAYVQEPLSFRVLRSALAVPLPGANGAASVLTLYQTEKDAFTKDHLRILLGLSAKLALSIENGLKFRHVESSATTDYLTGLPNSRSLFPRLETELARAKREGTPLGVAVCDLDGFKQVNDRFGHLEGNRVLQSVASELTKVCREYDYVARIGGDEFVLILPGLGPDAAQAKCDQLHDIAVAAGWRVCGEDVLSMSVGCAFHPEDGDQAYHLLRLADSRMFDNKRHAKNVVAGPPVVQIDSAVARLSEVVSMQAAVTPAAGAG